VARLAVQAFKPASHISPCSERSIRCARAGGGSIFDETVGRCVSEPGVIHRTTGSSQHVPKEGYENAIG
jgi:hypothetical protein